jgi:hypothetical protein
VGAGVNRPPACCEYSRRLRRHHLIYLTVTLRASGDPIRERRIVDVVWCKYRQSSGLRMLSDGSQTLDWKETRRIGRVVQLEAKCEATDFLTIYLVVCLTQG